MVTYLVWLAKLGRLREHIAGLLTVGGSALVQLRQLDLIRGVVNSERVFTCLHFE